MIVCDECGRENEDDYKFCLGCGHELSGGDGPEEDDEGESEEVACAYCGTRQPASFKFCGSCGERIPDEPEDPSEGKPARKTEETGGTGVPGGGAADDQSMPSPAPEQAAERVEEEGTAQAQLVVIQPDGTEGAAIEVRGDELEIGRASHFESLADDPFLSPHHATLVHRDGEYWLRDEDSVNGIFREVTDAVELGDHEFIRLGQELIEFEIFDGEPERESGGVALDGSPDPGYWGKLSLVAGPDSTTEAFALEGDEVTIGREVGDIVFPEDGFVSGSHAVIEREGDTVRLRDLDSSNGTFVRIRERHRVDDGERVLMGQQLFRLEVQ